MESPFKEHDEFENSENPESPPQTNLFGSDESGNDSVDSDGEVFYNKKFIKKCKQGFSINWCNLVFELKNFEEATKWIVQWIDELKNNPTGFAQDYPSLIEKGEEYRMELIKKFNITEKTS